VEAVNHPPPHLIIMKDPILLIDGDIIRYRCAFAAEKTYYLVTNDGMLEYYDTAKEAKENAGANYVWSRKEVQPVEFALQAAKTTMEALVERFKPSEVEVFLTGPGNFREVVARTKPYKGNRLEAKPKHFTAVGEYLTQSWGAKSVRGIEADDAIGIGLTNGDSCIAVSTDKDLRQIAGWHYDWVGCNLFQVSKRGADFTLYSQILTGDSTDNVPGLEGVGPSKAERILDGSKDSKELARRAWATYRDFGKSFDYFLEQAELIYIQRYEHDPWILNLEAALKPA
jgi:hypothetical protein